MTPRGYIICATPRSGSTLLCSLLRSTGVAGQPESWFRTQDRADWAKDWQIARQDGTYDWPTYLRAAIAAGSSANGVCGLRLMWNMACEVVAELGGAALPSQADLLAKTFGPLHFIHLSRRDLVAQAVSRHKAEVSGTWHLGFEEAETPQEPRYDRARIQTWLDDAMADNAAWDHWFAANRLRALRLYYEDLAADPAGTARQVLDHLGLSSPLAPTAQNRKMADATSAEWAIRFRADTAKEKGPGDP